MEVDETKVKSLTTLTSQDEINRMGGKTGRRIDPPTTPDLCKLPREIGPCRKAITRWYYDTEGRTCKSFNFGGCDGNENNFETEALCNKQCKEDDERNSG